MIWQYNANKHILADISIKIALVIAIEYNRLSRYGVSSNIQLILESNTFSEYAWKWIIQYF
jgi:hypothetical protein